MAKPGKDNNDLKISIFVVFILVIILAISGALYWYFIFKQRVKARPVIHYDNSPTNTTPNTKLLTLGEYDVQQPTTGYSYATLGQPCNKEAIKKAPPNIPAGYELQACDSSQGLVCTDSYFTGPVCLSQIGYSCDEISDCVPDADICLNNICSKFGDTLNNNCINSDECQAPVNGQNLYNHVCDFSNGNGICKIDSFPSDSGCKTDNDCAGDLVCTNGDQNAYFDLYTLTGTSFSIANQEPYILWPDLENSIITVYNTNKVFQGNYNISLWNNTSFTGELTPALNTTTNLSTNSHYLFSPGQENSGYCIEKLPIGSPANLTIGGLSIPCQDGLENVQGYCMNTDKPLPGQACINGVVFCQQVPSDGLNITPGCMYNSNLVDNIYSNTNFGLSPGLFKGLYEVGSCGMQFQDRGQPCNESYGCKEPYVCLNEEYDDGTSVSICGIPFQTQICSSLNCPEGYECDNVISGLEPPLCLGLSGGFAIQNGDCKSGNLTGYNLMYYDPENNKYISVVDNINLQNYNGNQKIHTVLSKSLVNNTNSKFPSNYYINKYVLFWYLDVNNICQVYLYDTTINILSHTNITFEETGNEIKNIVIDENDNVLVVYKQATRLARKRMIKINQTSYTLQGNQMLFYLDNNFHGLTMNSIIYFDSNNTNPSNDICRKNILMKIVNIDYNNNSVTGETLDGSNTNQPTSTNSYNNFIVTFSDEYVFYTSPNDGDRVAVQAGPPMISYNYTNVSGAISYVFNQGDILTYEGGNGANLYSLEPPRIGTCLANVVNFITYNFDNSKDYYISPIGVGCSITFSTDGTNYRASGVEYYNTHTYVFSDDYYGSTGGYPMIDGYKTFQQGLVNDQNDNFFRLNSNSYTYNITALTIQYLKISPQINTTEDFNITNVSDFSKNNIYPNGNRKGFSYVYKTEDDNVEIDVISNNNINYLLLSKDIKYISEDSKDGKITRTLKQMYKIKYNIGTGFDNNYEYNLKNSYLIQGIGNIDTYFNFTVLNNSYQQGAKGFYYNYQNNVQDMEIDNYGFIDNVQLNPYSEEEDLNIIFNTTNKANTHNNVENSIGINSVFNKITYGASTTYEPALSYSNFNNFEDLQPLELATIYSIGEKPDNTSNYFIPDQNLLYIYNQDDIDKILNYSSSELVITKTGTNGYPTGLSNDDLIPQIVWSFVNIIEYNVELNNEFMVIKINCPVTYDDDNIYEDLIKSSSPWLLHVYNFVPLEYYHIRDNSYYGNDTFYSYLYNLSNASIFYSGTKIDNYYQNSSLNLARTGYNKLLIRNTGIEENSSFDSTFKSPYSIYPIYDGAGVFLEKYNEFYLDINLFPYYSFYANENSYHLSGTSYEALYDINNNKNFYTSAMHINYNNSELISSSGTVPQTVGCFSGSYSNDGISSFKSYIVPSSLASTNVYYYSRFEPNNNDHLLYNNYTHFNNGQSFVHFFPISLSSLTYGDGNYLTAEPWPTTHGNFFDYNDFEGTDIRFTETNQKHIGGSTTYFAQFAFSGIIRLPVTIYGEKIYATNDLFLSSLPTGDTFYLNSTVIEKDYIINNGYNYDKSESKLKVLGHIKLYQDSYARYQTGTALNPEDFNEVNQVIIRWPEWLKARYSERLNQFPNLIKVFSNYNFGNIYGKNNYYAFVEYNGKISLVYLNNEDESFNLSDNEGVATNITIFNKGVDDDFYNRFSMSTPSKFLFLLGKSCVSS